MEGVSDPRGRVLGQFGLNKIHFARSDVADETFLRLDSSSKNRTLLLQLFHVSSDFYKGFLHF